MNTRNTMDETIIKEVIHRNCITKHITIPPGKKTWQSEVETSHPIIVKKFYGVEYGIT
ncbi:MAG: hypothetical protein U9R13_09185 [Campylobacterota bacterium]|nr:hypothetical protein [Campylobacterota bacterium]